ncbi:uncharacterized protein perm1a [Leuresthes tenuis]|uniref:uncharacterized protein perm1a n=1 Tax=Leuresthes tenuis TaxID=355514 RepID=UPI003B5093A8
MCRSLDEQEGLLTSQVRFSKKSGTIDIPNQESSPSSSLRRKKKKKRRLSVEAGQACERQVLVKQTDSEEEQHASREGAGDLQKFDKMNTSVNGCENEQYQNYSPAEDKSVSLLPSAESCAPPVEVSQNVKQSNAKSVLAAEAGNSGKDKSTLCQSELQQQLESDCHDTNPCSRTLGNVHFSAIHTLDAKSSQLEISDEVISTNLTSDCINQPYDKSYVPTYLSSLDPEQQTDHPIEVKTSDISSEKNTETERYPSEASQKLVLTCHTQTESKLSLSEGLKTSPSDITLVSSCCTLDTDSVTSFSNENLTDMSLSFCSSASEHESGSQGEKKVPILVKHEAEDFPPGPKSKPECKCDILGEAEDAVTASKAVDGPEKMEKSVFAMSSFWREMEKVTINDILGLRYIRKASSLPPVRESEETDLFAVCDQGNFTQNDESKQTEQITEETSVTEPYYSRSEVTWDSELVPVSHGGIIYPVNTLLASVTDTSEPVLSERSQKCIRKISKAISVHNLQALESESFGYTQKGQPLQTLDESESVKFEYITGDSAPKIDKDVKSLPSSVTDSYSISLTDIFQYLFGGKQSVPHHSATDDISTLYTGGNSVPETYDHFFSEFDTENFFYPLITAEEKKQDKTVPIFSCSRSAGRNLQFPEAYEYFFASSSSDDSSVESDEEDNCPPARVVSRFTPKTSSAEINTDIYEDFFTDSDFRDEFFCLKSLSFRKVKFSASRAQKQKSNSVSLVPVRQSCRSTLRADPHLNALGNSDVMFPDPLLYHLEERISRQLAQQPFIYEDLQATISNPGLDAPLMPLKQSDMCLVCIAFASWVLKTANPQVGDAWKAVLLANISALSAIRYLRKYVKMEAAANETTLHQPALTYP